MFPQLKGVGHIALRSDPVGFSPICFLSELNPLKQLVAFDQTCIETLFGGGREVIRFW